MSLYVYDISCVMFRERLLRKMGDSGNAHYCVSFICTDECLKELEDVHWFNILDLASGYWQAGPTQTSDSIDLDIHTELPERGQWDSKAEFILSCIGLSVGIGNVWRFPYLAYQNGGGAFLFPYIILLILVGKPMYYMEVALGQFSSLGPFSVWRCFPLGKGIGAAMVIISIVVSIYYNVVMSYCLFYVAHSFHFIIPWDGCFDWWGADNITCYVRTKDQVLIWMNKNALLSPDLYYSTLSNCTNATQTATEQFWEKFVLDMTDGIENIGTIKWDLAVCLLVSWIIVFLSLMKGVKSSGKVVYFTATFPYIILIILLVRGVTLPGAVTGIKYFFVPEWEKLLDIKVWQAAAEQLFFSLSVSWGSLIMFGSYNKFHNKVHMDAMFVSSLDFLTSLIAGIVIFSVLGNMSEELNIDIKNVAKEGPGLAFVAYPEALSQLQWLPQLWCILFFFMLFLLGLDSEFALLETFLTAIYDEFPSSRRHKFIITLFFCVVCFFLGLPCVTQGGQYVLNLMDTYGSGYSVIFIAICELIALMWGYGVCRFSDDMEFMLGSHPGLFWKACWTVISPLILMCIFVYSLAEHKGIKYGENYQYPLWADGVGWLLALISMGQIPLWGFFILLKNCKNLHMVVKAESNWGPGDNEARVKYFQDRTLNLVMTENINSHGINNPALINGTDLK
ncbi:sodium-dependent proline transporter-like [Limulus polyphemus]|uniref:Transporter n=1 Tax=Limulus polyphemus TaxID=6850 RepID=A0ABM1SYA1_LIMPO|nr:sodium-dependent proline transporter-like [Limulus polyphemus]